MSDDRYRGALNDAVASLRERWREGAPKGDPYRLGFNAGLWNALLAIEGAAEEAGIELKDIGMEDGWAEGREHKPTPEKSA